MCWARCISTGLLVLVLVPKLNRVPLERGFGCPFTQHLSLTSTHQVFHCILRFQNDIFTSAFMRRNEHRAIPLVSFPLLTCNFWLQLPASARQWINCLESFLLVMDTAEEFLAHFWQILRTHTKLCLVQALWCFIEEGWMCSGILRPSGVTFYVMSGWWPGCYTGE